MAKEWELVVHRPVPEKPGIIYPMRVLQIEKSRSKHKSVVATLQHLNQRYLGQMCRVQLPATIRGSSHPTAQFFAACGMAVHENAKLKPKSAIGATVGVVFAIDPASQEPEPVMFKSLKKETTDDERFESQPDSIVFAPAHG